MSNPSSTSGGGGGTGKASFSDLSIMCSVGKASPLLFKACATGEHIKKATLFVRKAGGGQQDYYVITLSDLLVSSIQQGPANTSDGRPTETFSLNFSKIEWSYTAADGVVTKTGWDVKNNTGI